MVDNLVIAVYFLVILAVGCYGYRKVKTLDAFGAAGRNFRWPVVAATLAASFIGGGYTIGNAEKVFRHGMVMAFCLMGFSLKEFLVGFFVAGRLQRHRHALTIADIMYERYGSRTVRTITGLLSVVLCVGILAAQVSATAKILKVFLGLESVTGVAIGVGMVILYSALGGMWSVVATDVVQFAIIMVGLPLTLILGIGYAGGWDRVVSDVPAGHLTLLGDQTVWAAVGLFVTFIIGETLVPPYVQRALIARTPRQAGLGAVISGIVSIPTFLITGAIGLLALSLAPQLDPTLALPTVIQRALPIGLTGLVIAAIIAVIMSSADSFLNSAALCLVQDLYRPLFRPQLSDKAGLWLARIGTVVLGIGAAALALTIQSVMDILLFSYNFWAPMVIVPLTAALWLRRVYWRAALAGMVTGAVATFAWWWYFQERTGVEALVIGFLANLIVFVAWHQAMRRGRAPSA